MTKTTNPITTLAERNAMTRDDVMRETIDHCHRVANLMMDVTERLNRRAVVHDRSKYNPDEFDAFAEATPRLRSLTYGSEEYKASLTSIQPALKAHYRANRHHPEHHAGGIDSMNLLDMIEMLADWKAATERHDDGDLRRSIHQNAERFGYGDDITRLLLVTAQWMGWLDGEPGHIERGIRE